MSLDRDTRAVLINILLAVVNLRGAVLLVSETANKSDRERILKELSEVGKNIDDAIKNLKDDSDGAN